MVKKRLYGLIISVIVSIPIISVYFYYGNSENSDQKIIRSIESKSSIVYVTKFGKKYHRGTCGYLKNSKIQKSINNIARKYSPCKVCRPNK